MNIELAKGDPVTVQGMGDAHILKFFGRYDVLVKFTDGTKTWADRSSLTCRYE